jgi:N-methylhydantoinase A/oxoprolinase/acetone carboxylase beta subunit
MKKILKTTGVIALKILKFTLENFMYLGAFYCVFRGEIAAAFLLVFMAIGLEVADLKKHIEKSTDAKVKDEAGKLVRTAFKEYIEELDNE